MAGIDPRTQVPPLGLLPYRKRWRPPFIYSDDDIRALMAEVPRVVCSALRVATYQTLIGLLAATGMFSGGQFGHTETCLMFPQVIGRSAVAGRAARVVHLWR